MVSMFSLWLPILLSAIAVFVASSVIHMFLGYHANDYKRLPDEDAAADALRPLAIPPGDYAIPHSSSMKEMQSDEYKQRMERGPVAFMTVLPSGQIRMGKMLGTWFVYCLIVVSFAAYVAGRARGAGGRVPGRLPVRGDRGLRRLRARALAGLHLVLAAVVHHAEEHLRRRRLRAHHRRHLRYVLAGVRRPPPPVP
jgi:hypothetical protein